MISNQDIKSQLYPNFQLNYSFYDKISEKEEEELKKLDEFIDLKVQLDIGYKRQLEQLIQQIN